MMSGISVLSDLRVRHGVAIVHRQTLVGNFVVVLSKLAYRNRTFMLVLCGEWHMILALSRKCIGTSTS